jgi:hypothetical protein
MGIASQQTANMLMDWKNMVSDKMLTRISHLELLTVNVAVPSNPGAVA